MKAEHIESKTEMKYVKLGVHNDCLIQASQILFVHQGERRELKEVQTFALHKREKKKSSKVLSLIYWQPYTYMLRFKGG